MALTPIAKGLVILGFAGLATASYSAARSGVGVKNMKDRKTVEEIKQNCPDGYKDRRGECLRTTFRSVYLLPYMRSSGGSGVGK